jgi:hypothetical protein
LKNFSNFEREKIKQLVRKKTDLTMSFKPFFPFVKKILKRGHAKIFENFF